MAYGLNASSCNPLSVNRMRMFKLINMINANDLCQFVDFLTRGQAILDLMLTSCVKSVKKNLILTLHLALVAIRV